MLLFNTPPELYFLKFRFFFMGTTAIPRNEIFIENLSYSTEYSAPRYFNLEYEMLISFSCNILILYGFLVIL